jgi:hypothetical protein
MNQKVDAAIQALKAKGHTVRPYSREGTFWFEIDGKMLASRKELEDLADRVYSLTELEDLFVRRQREEQNN